MMLALLATPVTRMGALCAAVSVFMLDESRGEDLTAQFARFETNSSIAEDISASRL